MKKLLTLALALSLGGCLTADVLRLETTPRPPTDPAAVELFLAAPDSLDFKPIAMVDFDTRDRSVGWDDILRKARAAAAKEGGMGLVLLQANEAQDGSTVISTMYGTSVVPQRRKQVRFAVIVW